MSNFIKARFIHFPVCSTKAKHTKRSKATDTAPGAPVQEEQSVERSKVVMVPNTAYNIFHSNSYVFHAETGGHQTLTLPRKEAEPQSSHSQVTEEEEMPLKLPPRIKRVSGSVDVPNSFGYACIHWRYIFLVLVYTEQYSDYHIHIASMLCLSNIPVSTLFLCST